MVLRADVTLEWAGGEHTFALRAKEIEALEAESYNPETGKHGVGLGAIWTRVMGGHWFITDIHNIIRLGLMGGGDVGATEARRLVRTYVDGTPISGNPPTPDCPLSVAQAVLAAAVIGVEAGDEADEGEQKTPQSQEIGGTIEQ